MVFFDSEQKGSRPVLFFGSCGDAGNGSASVTPLFGDLKQLAPVNDQNGGQLPVVHWQAADKKMVAVLSTTGLSTS